MITFLEDGLTDPRVAKESAPFDHPQLCLPHGHNGRNNGNLIGDTTDLRNLPEVGQDGHSADILTFEQMLRNTSEPHDLADSCLMAPAPNVN